MAQLPIVILAYFFAVVDFAFKHALIVVPLMVAVWLLLFVPSRTWASIRHAIAAPLRRTKPVAKVAEPRHRELAHSR
ncbi:hypothetical protein [Antrihabitans stalactiti]|uniref:Uncharacterized protein n=1 Tax=Antrihabitans stalactiti TaxID=2584121 RepID=A0A848KEH8_9NOCA|nr:hypothetical protein [Antrihabitans stalactiti]NMN96631.1 hypothetical protein [Antrihabitans stalactiti]